MEQQDILFAYFVSIFQLILVLTYAILMVLDRTAWDRHLEAFFLGCLRKAGIKKFLCHDWLMLYSPLSWYSPFSRFGGTATVISRLNFLVFGYFIQFPDYHYHKAATNTFSSWAYFATLSI